MKKDLDSERRRTVCWSCKRTVPSAARFCGYCGAKLKPKQDTSQSLTEAMVSTISRLRGSLTGQNARRPQPRSSPEDDLSSDTAPGRCPICGDPLPAGLTRCVRCELERRSTETAALPGRCARAPLSATSNAIDGTKDRRDTGTTPKNPPHLKLTGGVREVSLVGSTGKVRKPGGGRPKGSRTVRRDFDED